MLRKLTPINGITKFDDFVKSPDAAFRFTPRRCGVRLSTPHSSRFARLACELFTKPSSFARFSTFYESIKFTKLFSARQTQKTISHLLKHFHGRFIPLLILLFLAMLLGCGGSGPITDTPTPATGGTGAATGSIVLSLTKLSDNSPTTSVSVDSPAKLTATAADSAGHRIVLKVMSFSTTSDLLFDPASATALTDANGTASIVVKAGKTTGATTIKAEITDDSGTAVSGTISLSVTGTGTVTESIILSLTKLSDNSATTSVSVDSPTKLTATAKDSSGRPIAFQVISFSKTSALSFLSFDPASGTALTDVNGTASITVKAGNTTGATTIRAEITDSSGTIVSGTISLSITP